MPRSPPVLVPWEGKAKSAHNASTHGFEGLHTNPLAPGCFLKVEDERQFLGLLNECAKTYHPQHPDELDLLSEAVFAEWRQNRMWMAETAPIEIAIAEMKPAFAVHSPPPMPT